MVGNSLPVSIAKMAIETYFQTGEYLNYGDDVPSELKRRSGVFVCLKIKNELRGCIGTIEPSTDSIVDEIVKNAISSAVEDPRFPPVNKEELEDLSFSVDILGPNEKVSSINELDPKKYGVIVSFKNARGLLLPDLDGVVTPEQQIEIALQKAGISFESEFDIYRFEVKRYV